MPPLTLEQALQIAYEHHRAGRLNEAEPIYRQILVQSPGHAPAWYLLARLLAQRGQYGPAIEAVSKAVAAQPDAAGFHKLLGECPRRSRRLDEAITPHSPA